MSVRTTLDFFVKIEICLEWPNGMFERQKQTSGKIKPNKGISILFALIYGANFYFSITQLQIPTKWNNIKNSLLNLLLLRNYHELIYLRLNYLNVIDAESAKHLPLNYCHTKQLH